MLITNTPDSDGIIKLSPKTDTESPAFSDQELLRFIKSGDIQGTWGYDIIQTAMLPYGPWQEIIDMDFSGFFNLYHSGYRHIAWSEYDAQFTVTHAQWHRISIQHSLTEVSSLQATVLALLDIKVPLPEVLYRCKPSKRPAECFYQDDGYLYFLDETDAIAEMMRS